MPAHRRRLGRPLWALISLMALVLTFFPAGLSSQAYAAEDAAAEEASYALFVSGIT